MDLERGNLSRRGFLTRSLAGLAAAGLPIWFAKDLVATAEQDQAKQKQPVQPNDRIVMGLIGCGGQGRGDMNAARGRTGVQMVAVCDVDRAHRQQAAQAIGGDVAQFNDFRELLARRDINAVIVGTPDHWHAAIAIAAMRAGKDVYCEKPLTLTIEESKAVARVARETNRRLQTGSQQRSEFNGRFRMAVELVRNGRIGRIQSIDCRLEPNPTGGPFRVSQVPEGLDWNFWKGPTPDVEYVREKCHYTFRWWYAYSGGKMTDWGAHHLDIAQWALDMDGSGPTEIEGVGSAPRSAALCYDVHPKFTATYRYANGCVVRATTKTEPSHRRPNGVRFNGEDGKWIFVHRGGVEASDRRLIDEALPNNATRLPASNTSHMGNFIDCVRSREQPICNAAIGHRSVSVCHLGTIAIRMNANPENRNGPQRLRWDPEREQFVDNDAANRWLSREYRAPWRLDAQ